MHDSKENQGQTIFVFIACAAIAALGLIGEFFFDNENHPLVAVIGALVFLSVPGYFVYLWYYHRWTSETLRAEDFLFGTSNGAPAIVTRQAAFDTRLPYNLHGVTLVHGRPWVDGDWRISIPTLRGPVKVDLKVTLTVAHVDAVAVARWVECTPSELGAVFFGVQDRHSQPFSFPLNNAEIVSRYELALNASAALTSMGVTATLRVSRVIEPQELMHA